MREIKFRGISKVTNKFVYGYYIFTHEYDRHGILYEDHDDYEDFYIEEVVIPETVGQYTGLKDSFGNEIYEGDIIEIHYDEDLTTKPFDIGVVKYQVDDDYPAFDLEPYMDVEMNALSWLKSDSDPSVKYFKVIGNIYENPELIGEKND